jgi:hypothetical protein
MCFSIHTLGTRGDTQPYLALSRGLRAHGHEVLRSSHLPREELEKDEVAALADDLRGSSDQANHA